MTQRRYWFPAKRYGIGWGLPSTWEGWLTLAALVFVVTLDPLIYPPQVSPIEFAIVVSLAVGLFLALCFLKGEPPRWRDGDKS